MKKYRALWLMNHNTLRPFEVPMLIDMGYEVYCPKMFPYDEGNMSASIEYAYDETLSIPEDVLEELNQVNFYKQVSNHVLDLMNEYFDIAFFGFFPEQLKMLVEGFKGVLVMQPFGLATNVTYTKVIEQCLGVSFLEKLEKLGERFFFGQAYDNIAEIEYRYFRNRAIYLPLGLKNAYVDDQWMGGDNRILFVCPRINTSPYFHHIYESFKKDFENLDYVIGGAQPIDVTDDERVLGYIPKDQYEYNMTHLSAMFYHSQEKRHLHYHPLEAVKQGMPLIYMQGGLLEQIAGEKLPGACDSIAEAKEKISKVIKGDKKFIRRVKEAQAVLLEPFQYEFCRKQWEAEFFTVRNVLEKMSVKKYQKNEYRKQKKKIGFLLPEAYTGGVLDYVLRFIKCMERGIKESGKNIEVVFGYINKPPFNEKDFFYDLRKRKIDVRSFEWKCVDENYLNMVMEFKGIDKVFEPGEYCLADDGGNFFEDCDYLILGIDRVPFSFFTSKPYIVVVHDYIQRYMPEQYGDFYEKCVIDLQRQADSVFVMTLPTLEDGLQYAGLKREKMKLTPLMFDAVNIDTKIIDEEENIADEYFLWSTNIGKHKNHIKALMALSEYYAKGGKLACYVTGVNTKMFDLEERYDKTGDYISSVREMIALDPLLKKNLHFCGNMSKAKYYKTLKGAKFFMHPGFTDNGNMTAIDAAFLGIPTLTSDYPAMRYYEEHMKLGMKFFNPFEEKEIAQALFEMEGEYAERAKKLPDVKDLEKYTIKYTYMQLYKAVEDVFRF